MATDLHLRVAGKEMGQEILDLVGLHLLDMKAGFLITTSGGIVWTTLMKILEIVASLTGHHRQSGALVSMDVVVLWIGKGMRGDQFLHLHLPRLHLVEDGQIVIQERGVVPQ